MSASTEIGGEVRLEDRKSQEQEQLLSLPSRRGEGSARGSELAQLEVLWRGSVLRGKDATGRVTFAVEPVGAGRGVVVAMVSGALGGARQFVIRRVTP